MSSKHLLIVGHVPSANTLAMRNAVDTGARSTDIDGVDVTVLNPFETQPKHVLKADAIILGTTENLGYMSGALKDFFDRCYYPVLEEKQGLPMAVYIRAGLDGTGTRRGIKTITTGLRWRMVQEPLLCKGEWQENWLEQCEELGLFMAAGLEMSAF
jgi:hypothetical protein